MKRTRLAAGLRTAGCAALATASLAAVANAHARYAAVRQTVRDAVATNAPDKSASVAKQLGQPLDDRRPMNLTVTLPDGKVLQPEATKSAAAAIQMPEDRLAQNAELTMLLDRNGELTDSDEILESDNSRFDVYLVEGSANQTVAIAILSNAFDPYLMVLDSDGNTVAQNDDISPSNTNAGVEFALPSSGTYLIVVNGIDSSSRGAYRVMASAVAGVPTAPTVTSFTCNNASSCTVFEGASDYLSFRYTDPNGNASEWTLNDFTAEIYPVNGRDTIVPGIDCTCPTGVGDCNAPATNTYTVSMKDTSGRTSNSRSVTVTCSP